MEHDDPNALGRPVDKPCDTDSGGDQCMKEEEAIPLSKRQQKRQLKHQKWLQRKEEMRKNRKAERRKAKEKRVQTGEPAKKIYKMASEEASQVKVAIDCGFDDLMSRKDIRQFVKQIQRSYAENRRSPKPLQFYLCNLTGETADTLNECSPGYINWDVHIKSEKPVEVFDKESIVYLTSDSPNVLETLEDGKAYIIGGLVDHNHHKGLCYKRATEAGIAHAQLPISDYVKLQSRNVLAINHVFEILVRYVQSGDWKQAFFSVIPQRKGVSDLGSGDGGSQSSGGKSREDAECERVGQVGVEEGKGASSQASGEDEERDVETMATENEGGVIVGTDDSDEVMQGNEGDSQVGSIEHADSQVGCIEQANDD